MSIPNWLLPTEIPDTKLFPCFGFGIDLIQKELDAPKPWIGVYIVVASAFCGIAMALDVFNGFKTKNIWFPCKYFSLNAISLTLLSVAMKLTMDLTSSRNDEKLASYSSFVLMSSSMGNFMTSMASMDDKGIIQNLTALGILVITIVVNQWLILFQLNTKFFGQKYIYFDDFASFFLLLYLILLCTSAIIAPTTKRYIEAKFMEMHKKVLSERTHGAKFTAQELRVILKKYWIMAGTGNPQFILVRSVICIIPSVVCLSMTLILLILIGLTLYKERYHAFNFFSRGTSYLQSYGWIVIIQTVGATIGIIAPTFRLFVAVRLRNSRANRTTLKEELKTETYWTQRLIDWKENPMTLHIRYFKCKKLLHISKRVLLEICIKIQIMIVVTSKLTLIICAVLIDMTSFNFTIDRRGLESRAAGTNELDFSPYVMLLEGELELPNRIITNISNEADKLVQIGNMRKPKHIIELLQKSENFYGVRDFNRKSVTSLHVQEPKSCWSLSVVILTSIAIAIPNISSHIVQQLFSWASEGLPFVDFIEKKTDSSGELGRLRETAYIIWEGLEFDQKREARDGVQGNNTSDQAYKDTLLKLSTEAKETVIAFKTSTIDSVLNNPLNWPTKVIAANSMYRICESLLLIENDGTAAQFTERLFIIISDILAACLTNLANLIYRECYINPIEKRQESIEQALILLGESKEIIQCLEQREWPNLDPEKAAYIEEWQAIMVPGDGVFTTTTDNS